MGIFIQNVLFIHSLADVVSFHSSLWMIFMTVANRRSERVSAEQCSHPSYFDSRLHVCRLSCPNSQPWEPYCQVAGTIR